MSREFWICLTGNKDVDSDSEQGLVFYSQPSEPMRSLSTHVREVNEQLEKAIEGLVDALEITEKLVSLDSVNNVQVKFKIQKALEQYNRAKAGK